MTKLAVVVATRWVRLHELERELAQEHECGAPVSSCACVIAQCWRVIRQRKQSLPAATS